MIRQERSKSRNPSDTFSSGGIAGPQHLLTVQLVDEFLGGLHVCSPPHKATTGGAFRIGATGGRGFMVLSIAVRALSWHAM